MRRRIGRRLAAGLLAAALAGFVTAGFAWAAMAQTAEEAARFVFENATVNPGSAPAFNPDGQRLVVQLAGCELRLTRAAVFTDARVGPPGLFGSPGRREEFNPRPLEEIAVIRLDRVDLRTGSVTTIEERDGVMVSRFRFRSDPSAVVTHTVRLAERPDGAQILVGPDGFDDLAWPDLTFALREEGEKAGRHKAAFEYLIGRYCAGKSSAY